jgi:hypothetical protein
LCVPSMRSIQKGFKSPVYKMNIEEQKGSSAKFVGELRLRELPKCMK